MRNRKTPMTALCLGLIAAGATLSGGQSGTTRQPAPAERTRTVTQIRPTEAQRARLAELISRDKAWLARTQAEFAAAAGREVEQLRQRRQAALRTRNDETRARMAGLVREAETPAAAAEARRLEIQLEAAALLERSRSATPAEQDEIDRRADQLAQELDRLPR